MIPKNDWWMDYPWRLIQTNLREIDMEDIDAASYVEELKAFCATAVMINTSGIIASYPTELPFHYQSQYLHGDSLVKIIDACHAAGIKVLARTDFSKVRYPLYQKHPEWAYRDPQGNIVNYEGDVHCCINGDYQQKYMYEILKETLAKLDVDGIFFNMGGYQVGDYSGVYHGFCHCAACKKLFREYSGMDIPANDKDASFKAYSIFRQETMHKYNRQLIEFLQEIKPDLAICCVSEKPDGYIRQESNTALNRPLPHWQYDASASTKWAVANYPHMLSSTNTVDFIDIPVRHVAVSPAQQGLRLAQVLMAGGSLDYYLIGRLDNHEDKTGYEYIKSMYHFHAANEDSFKKLTSRAKIALIQPARGSYGYTSNSEYRGWYRFLAETQHPFDVILPTRAEHIDMSRYDTVILPNVSMLPDGCAKLLDEFVKNGGTLIAAGETGVIDEKLDRRASAALACLGLEEINLKQDIRAGYFNVDEAAVAAGMPLCSLIYGDGDYLYAKYASGVTGHLPMRPPQPFGPPERCYTLNTSDWPCYTQNVFGKGRAFFIPWYPGSLYYRQGYANTLDFARAFLTGVVKTAPIGGLSPMVEVSLNEGDGFSLLQLVNGSGHFGTSFFDPLPMAGLTVSVPGFDKMPGSVRALASGKALAYRVESGVLTIELPKLGLYEAIRIE